MQYSPLCKHLRLFDYFFIHHLTVLPCNSITSSSNNITTVRHSESVGKFYLRASSVPFLFPVPLCLHNHFPITYVCKGTHTCFTCKCLRLCVRASSLLMDDGHFCPLSFSVQQSSMRRWSAAMLLWTTEDEPSSSISSDGIIIKKKKIKKCIISRLWCVWCVCLLCLLASACLTSLFIISHISCGDHCRALPPLLSPHLTPLSVWAMTFLVTTNN